MAPIVSTAVMEETWRSVATMSDAAIVRIQKQCGKGQHDLSGFVLGFTSDLDVEALGLALYTHNVVAEAFRRTGTKFKKVKSGTIDRTWKDNFVFVNDLRSAGFTATGFNLPTGVCSEPAVLQYVIDALTEDQEEDPVSLSEADFWRILQVLKTFADCMHNAGEG